MTLPGLESMALDAVAMTPHMKKYSHAHIIQLSKFLSFEKLPPHLVNEIYTKCVSKNGVGGTWLPLVRLIASERTRLTELILQGVHIDHQTIIAIHSISETLRSLVLCMCTFDAPGTKIRKLDGLRSLRFYQCEIRPGGAIMFVDFLSACPNIVCLTFDRINGFELAETSMNFMFKNLELFALENSSFPDAIVSVFRHCQKSMVGLTLRNVFARDVKFRFHFWENFVNMEFPELKFLDLGRNVSNLNATDLITLQKTCPRLMAVDLVHHLDDVEMNWRCKWPMLLKSHPSCWRSSMDLVKLPSILRELVENNCRLRHVWDRYYCMRQGQGSCTGLKRSAIQCNQLWI